VTPAGGTVSSAGELRCGDSEAVQPNLAEMGQCGGRKRGGRVRPWTKKLRFACQNLKSTFIAVLGWFPTSPRPEGANRTKKNRLSPPAVGGGHSSSPSPPDAIPKNFAGLWPAPGGAHPPKPTIPGLCCYGLAEDCGGPARQKSPVAVSENPDGFQSIYFFYAGINRAGRLSGGGGGSAAHGAFGMVWRFPERGGLLDRGFSDRLAPEGGGPAYEAEAGVGNASGLGFPANCRHGLVRGSSHRSEKRSGHLSGPGRKQKNGGKHRKKKTEYRRLRPDFRMNGGKSGTSGDPRGGDVRGRVWQRRLMGGPISPVFRGDGPMTGPSFVALNFRDCFIFHGLSGEGKKKLRVSGCTAGT